MISINECKIICLPGVPHEMKNIFYDSVIPFIKTTNKPVKQTFKLIKTVGVSESKIAGYLEGVEKNLHPELKLAYLPSAGRVLLKVSGPEKLEKEISDTISDIRPLIEKIAYTEEDKELEEVVGQILFKRHLTLSSAESCTGGYIAHKITSVPGSSSYFLGSIISYDNSVKINSLGVSEETLSTHGAVSEETVIQMAKGVREKLGTSISVSTSGIAGPGGGTEEKPVGTVWVALAHESGVITKKLQLTLDRNRNFELTCVYCLDMIRRFLMNIH